MMNATTASTILMGAGLAGCDQLLLSRNRRLFYGLGIPNSAKNVQNINSSCEGTMSEELANTIRAAVNSSGRQLPAIAKETGVEESALTEFMDGADIHLTTATKIAACVGLELKLDHRPKDHAAITPNASQPARARHS
jgi:hypothetical protein